MANDLSRRRILALFPAGLLAASLPRAAHALDVGQARDLVGKLVGEINTVIASGTSEGAMIGKFEGIFTRYADVNYIAQSALGPAGRGLPKGELSAYTKAFSGYLARKYGKRFREFIGGQIEVTDARPLKSFYEVVSVARLRGQAPFEVRWHIFDKSGKNRFFNLIIEGVNMLAAERTEIGALLDRAGGDIGGLTKALASAG